MTTDSLMQRLRKDLGPAPRVRRQIEQRIAARIGEPHSLRAGDMIQIPAGVKEAVWRRVVARIGVLRTSSLLMQLREFLQPRRAPRQRLQVALRERLAGTPQPAYASERFKWVAATMAAVMVIASSPAFFLMDTTVAVAHVMLVPTAGTVEISRQGGAWELVTDDVILEPGIAIRTTDGQASIIYRDDAVLRLDADSTVETFDTSELLEPAPEVVPAFALQSGRIWLQGLLPNGIRGLTVALPGGSVTVHEGSVSLSVADKTADIAVWDRHADIVKDGMPFLLVADEMLRLDEGAPAVSAIPAAENEALWSQQNLTKDAVHRRQIAQQQQQRRAALAGILPTSTLYPVKRIAEEVDVFLTFNEEDKVQKKLELANERLNEAAALLLSGAGSGADVTQSLAMYRTVLLDLAADSGSRSTVAQFLIRQSLTETIADVTALQPDDNSYVLKQAVIETTAQLPTETLVNPHELQTMLFVDALATLNDAVARGDATTLHQSWSELQEYVDMVAQEDSPLPPALRKEAQALLERFASVVQENSAAVAAVDAGVLQAIVALVPTDASATLRAPILTEEQINQMAQAMIERIYSYKMPRSRLNQLQVEVSSVRGQPEEGSILRELHELLPAQSQLSAAIRRDIARLRWQRAGETYAEETPDASGTGAAL